VHIVLGGVELAMVNIKPGFSQELMGKNVLILGYGVSGQSAELFISQRGGKCLFTMRNP